MTSQYPSSRQIATLRGAESLLTFSWASLAYLVYLPMLGLALFLGQVIFSYPHRLWRRFYQGGWLFITVLFAISATRSQYSGEAWLQLSHYLPYFVLWAALYEYLSIHAAPLLCLKRWLWLLVLGSMPLSGLAFIQQSEGIWRPAALFSNPNIYGNYGVMLLGLSLGLGNHIFSKEYSAETRSWPIRIVVGAVILLLLAGIYYTGSRNSYAVAIVLCFLSVLAMTAKLWVKLLGFLGIVTATSVGLLLQLGSRNAFTSSWLDTDPRPTLWRIAINLAEQSPIWGQGLGSYKFLYQNSLSQDSALLQVERFGHAHNLWLSLMAEAGILVTVSLTWVVGIICYRAVKAILVAPIDSPVRWLGMAYGFSFLAMVLFSSLDITFFDARLNLLSWLCLTVLSLLPKWVPAA